MHRYCTYVALMTITACMGCDSRTFLPPAPPELGDPFPDSHPALSSATQPHAPATGRAALKSGASTTFDDPIKRVALIVAGAMTIERQKLAQLLRTDAGRLKFAFRLHAPESAYPLTPEEVVEAIKKVTERPCALAIDAVESTAVCEALQNARSRGSVIISLDSTLACSTISPPINSVKFTGFPKIAERLVESALSESKSRSFRDDCTIIILRNRLNYSYAEARFNSLMQAIKAKNRSFETIEFEGDYKTAQIALTAYLKSHGQPTIIVTQDHDGLAAGSYLHQNGSKDQLPPTVLVGFAIYDIREGFVKSEDCPSFAVQDVGAYSQAVLRTIRQLIDGGIAPIQTAVPVDFIRISSGPSLPVINGSTKR